MKVTYNNKNAVFFNSLKADVEKYFKQKGIKKTGNWKLYLKSILLIPSCIGIYLFLLASPVAPITGILLSSLLGFLLACIGFNVMHDANHGSYSTKEWINNLLGLTMNALGSSAFLWKQKHNIIHHTYTNVDGIDDDIAKAPALRLCHTQEWKPFHRIQHIYLPLAYGISSVVWVFYFDIVKYFQKRIHNTQLKKMDRKEHFLFWSTKALYILFYIAIPVYFVGWGAWAIGFMAMHFALGFTLSIVFQLAHVVEETEFEFVDHGEHKVIENEWAIHQIKTTANFATNNKVISWFVGGLNFQVEHHLFPRISHVHYPAISKIVEAKCKEFGLQYNNIPTMNQAVASHVRFIKTLAQKPVLAQPQPVLAKR